MLISSLPLSLQLPSLCSCWCWFGNADKTKGGWWIFYSLHSYLLISPHSPHNNNPMSHFPPSLQCSLISSAHRMIVLFWLFHSWIERKDPSSPLYSQMFVMSPRAYSKGHTLSQWHSVAISLLMFPSEALYIELNLIIRWTQQLSLKHSESIVVPPFHPSFLSPQNRSTGMVARGDTVHKTATFPINSASKFLSSGNKHSSTYPGGLCL